jgi:nicotinate-nucleotide adenylyltransferase
MMMKKKVGILGGSFDPVHFGHLNLAICLMESCSLEEVLFVPTSLSPFKENAPPIISAEHRLAMLKIAIAPLKKFSIVESEIYQKGPAYTIDTVRKISKDFSLQLHLLIGEDHLESLHHWKEIDELMRLAPPLVGTREIHGKTPSLSMIEQKTFKLQMVKIPLLDISSTAIRQRLSQKKYCGHLVPAGVLAYIQNNHLYN